MKYNKHYCKRSLELGEVLIENDAPVLGEVAVSDINMEKRHADILNQNWKQSGVYYAEAKKAAKAELDREALKSQADELGIDYQKNIKTDKLAELIKEKGE